MAAAHAVVSSNTVVSTTLHAYVHEDNSIGLTYDDGSPVNPNSSARIPAGTYTVRVIDDADIHNFHLFGPGVDKATTVGDSSSPTWTVTFQSGGQYTFQCDVHSDFMIGFFQASGTAPPSTTTSPGPGTTPLPTGGSPLRGTLAATVKTTGKPVLSFKGKTVTKLKAGRYAVAVVDTSKKRGFVVKRSGHAAITVTSAAFVGRRGLVVNFTAGKWTYSASPGGTPATAFSVTG